jgi:thiol-disulfide isomerase/thioredoxin
MFAKSFRHSSSRKGELASEASAARPRQFPLFVSILWALALATVTGCSSLPPGAQELIGQPVPEARLMLLSGDDVAIRPDDGKIKVILFWATWCRYSRSAIEDFEALAREYRDRRDVNFYAASLDRNEDLPVLESRIREQELHTVQHVFSGNDIQDEAFISVRGSTIPYAVVIGPDGKVTFLGVGVSGLESYLHEALSPRG